MPQEVTTHIDPELCNGCGLCLRVCPSQTISLVNGKARVTGDSSLNCGHCAAVCPEGAVTVGSLDPEQSRFDTFSLEQIWLPFGDYDLAGLVRLMASRRSCRNYKDRPVPREMLSDLVKIGLSAPSGTNSQLWSFTVLSSRERVMAMASEVGRVIRDFNRLSEKAWLRGLLRLVGKPELDDYYREYHQSVSRALDEWDNQGVDRLFHGASAAILVGSLPGASCPAEDALLASGQMLLAAQAMGLGTCLVGYAVEVLKRQPALARQLGARPGEKIHAVIALGWPNEKYRRITGRRAPVLRWA
ncbi:MAG: nitroreductase family protein [Desulfarculaceae bacterium]|nr:nitroreductase family protein [Desulfarculaceae bacterium]MCF8074131.1 nitroreductase family protein [Desulfarculaceae bacterium]MCF8103277.1 nitroreductase family protein [Desulfarculaceae bacterium]MCF8116865.1 nitroreductase family protein [Desulfarculaceae bacterium]